MLDAAIRQVRRAAVALNLIPQTMAGKKWLKRVFYGSLEPIPAELAPGGATGTLHPLDDSMDLTMYRTIYAEAQKIR